MIRLWRSPRFLTVWGGQTVSLFGSRVTYVALPLTAILLLHASALQMGLLVAVEQAPAAVVGLVAGVMVDRLPRRGLMIACDLGRAAVFTATPLAGIGGQLQMADLYVAGLVAGGCDLLFSTAYEAYLPTLLGREELAAGNSMVELSESLAQVAGPGLGGVLMQLLTVPGALLADALSYVLSAASLLFAGSGAANGETDAEPAGSLLAGVRLVWNERRLRDFAVTSGLFTFFDSLLFSVYWLFLSRTLHFTPFQVGLVFGVGGAGGIAGAVVAGAVIQRAGLGRSVLAGLGMAVVGELLIAAAHGPLLVALSLLLAAETLVETGATVYSIGTVTLRQTVTDSEVLGRVVAASRVPSWVAAPGGAIAGGILAGGLGIRSTVLVAGLGTASALLWAWRSPAVGIHAAVTPGPGPGEVA